MADTKNDYAYDPACGLSIEAACFEYGQKIYCLEQEIELLRQLCDSAIDALGCDRSRDDRLHVQELIHKALEGGE